MTETPSDTPGSDLGKRTVGHDGPPASLPSPRPGAPRTVNNTLSGEVPEFPFGQPPGAATLAGWPPSSPPLPRIPGYEVFDLLGRGGMGVVYKARQVSLNRTVALKMVAGVGLINDEELARFRIEAQALARLLHPGIVQVYEVGEAEGVPYFSLEFVAGGTLAQKVNRTPQPAAEAARVVEQLARAVAAAHAAGIVHRDLKPGNVLLAADGTPKVTDFGLAKQLGADSGQTRTGQVVGTPSYMAPEQAAGASEVGRPADVYALGAILYDMLTGRPPFEDATILGTLEQVRTQEPVPPSRLVRGVPRDLESICLRCMEKDSRRRYFTAEALADDLRRFLDGQPVLARPVGTAERWVKWVRRKPAIAALWAAGFLLALAVTGTAVAVAYSGELAEARMRAEAGEAEAITQRERAEQREKDANSQRIIAETQTAEVEKQRAALAAAKQEAEAQRRRAERFKYIGDMNLAVTAWRDNDSVRARGLLALHAPAPGADDNRGFEWHFLDRQFHSERRVWPIPEFTGVPTIDTRVDGTVCVVVPDAKGSVWLGNVGSGAWKEALREPIEGVARLGGGRLAISAPRSAVVEFTNPEAADLRPPGSTIVGLQRRGPFDLSPDGTQLAVIADKELRVYDVASRKILGALPGVADSPRPVFSPDGSTVVGYDPGTQRMVAFNPTTGKFPRTSRSFPVAPDQVICPAALPGMAAWVSPAQGMQPTMLNVWRLDGLGVRSFVLKLPDLPNRGRLCIAVSPDARFLLVGGEGAGVHVFAPSDGRQIGYGGGAETNVSVTNQLNLLTTLVGHEGRVAALAFSEDGKQLVTVGHDQTVRVWDFRHASPLRPGYVVPAPGPDAHFVVEKAPEGKVRVSDPAGRTRATIHADLGSNVAAPPVAVAPGARWAALGSFTLGAQVDVWSDDRDRPDLTIPGEPGRMTALLVASPDGRHLAAFSQLRRSPTGAPTQIPRTQLWDVDARKLVWERGPEDAGAPTFSPSGRLVALQGLGRVTVLDAATGEPRFARKQGQVVAVEFPRGDEELLLVQGNGTITHVNLPDGRERAWRLGQTTPVRAAGVSADGKRLATADATDVRVWDIETGQQTLMLSFESTQPIRRMIFSRGGRCLIADPAHGRFFEWDCTPRP